MSSHIFSVRTKNLNSDTTQRYNIKVKKLCLSNYLKFPKTPYQTAEVAKALIEAGPKVNAKDEGDGTPLHTAALIGKAELIEFLLSAGANAKAKDKEGKKKWLGKFEQRGLVL